MGQEKKDYVIRFFKPSDEDKIVTLLKNTFQPWPKADIDFSPVDHWRWKFLDNPANVTAQALNLLPLAIAVNNGEIIGADHSIIVNVKIGDNTHLCLKAAEACVAVNFQGMGVFSKIDKLSKSRMKELKCEIRYGLTENPILLKKKDRDQQVFPFPNPIKFLIRIKNIQKHFKNMQQNRSGVGQFILKMGVYGYKLLNTLTNLDPKPPKTKLDFKETSRFDRRIEEFYDRVKPHYSFIVEKTAEYMNWRFCDKRGGDFKSWVAEEDGKFVGYVVLRVNKIVSDYPVGYIMDLMALHNRLDVAESLVDFAIHWFDSMSVNIIRAQLVGGHAYERILSKYGFLDSRIKQNLTYRVIDIKAEDLEKFRKATHSMLYYNYGESDTI